MLYPHSEFDSEEDAMLWAMFLLDEGAAQVQVIEHSTAGCFYVTGANSLDDAMPQFYSWGKIVYQGKAVSIDQVVADVA